MSVENRICPVVFGLNCFVTPRGGGYVLVPGIAATTKLSMIQF